jgi:hypothetical protein
MYASAAQGVKHRGKRCAKRLPFAGRHFGDHAAAKNDSRLQLLIVKPDAERAAQCFIGKRERFDHLARQTLRRVRAHSDGDGFRLRGQLFIGQSDQVFGVFFHLHDDRFVGRRFAQRISPKRIDPFSNDRRRRRHEHR